MITEPNERRGMPPMLSGLGALLIGLSSLFQAGCEEELPPGTARKVVKFESIPPEVVAAARKAIPGVTFNDGWENVNKEGKVHSYEVRGKAANGKTREVRVSPSGEILEME